MDLHDERYATYLPAVNKSYLSTISRNLPRGRRFPAGITPMDLAFWEPNSLWWYPYILHSIGQYSVGERPHALMAKRSRSKSTLIGDSGGYQIGKGTLGGLKYVKRRRMSPDEAVQAWRKEREARNWIRKWLASECEYGMTIDMPLWAKSHVGRDSPFHLCSSDQLISMTVQNLRVLTKHSPPGFKWLNVIQGGESYVDAIDWWRQVKRFRLGGWALAGSVGVAGGLCALLITLLMMRDEDGFTTGQDWLHVLGVSTPLWAVLLSAVQRSLQRVNPDLRVSFDSSSPFLLAGRFEEACISPTFNDRPSSWSIRSRKVPQKPSLADPENKARFAYRNSPLGSRLLLNELNVKEGMWQVKQFDSFSNALLANHNTWTYVDAFKTANDIVASEDWARVPPLFQECIEFVGAVFEAESSQWFSMIEKHQKLLDSVAPPTL